MQPGTRPVLILGLDGATFEVIDPLLRAGRLPFLTRCLREGVRAPLASTVPPMSFPAWSSFLTGLLPGRHGIFDFTQKVPGAYRIRFANATDRAGASLFARVSRAGGRVLGLGVPATFPPEPVNGLLVAGFDAPVSSGSDARSASDPALYAAVAERSGPWMQPDLDEGSHGEGWHERALEVLLARVRRKTGFAREALRQLAGGGRPELAVVIFSESDTVQHHFWRDHDPDSPRHDPTASAARKAAVTAAYEALDAACAELREAYGEDALCLVVSDHGAGGASRRVLHLNRYLADCGLLQRRPGRRGPGLDALARGARDTALRLLPPRAAQAVFRRARAAAARVESAVRFAGLDHAHSVAFSEEVNTQPGVWINRAGREAQGCVASADYEKTRAAVIDALDAWRLPGGDAVVARALPREEVYAGPFVERAPDVVFELALEAGYAHSLVSTPWQRPELGAIRTLEGHELGGGRGRGMNGTHRPEGIFVASGPGASAIDFGRAPSLADVAPTALAALGVAWDEGLDGEALSPTRLDYSPEEEARVAARLRALGYLE